MSKTLGERIRDRREELGLSQEQLGSLVGLQKAQISNIETGKRGTPVERLQEFAQALKMSVSEIIEGSVDPKLLPIPGALRGRLIPIISWVKAGDLAEAIDCWPAGVSGEGSPVLVHKGVSLKSFALKVVGNSMETRFKEGDIIVVDPEIEVQTGDYCIAKVAGEVTFKQYYENGTEIRLKALSPKFPDIVFPKAGAVDFQIVGKVVEMIPKL